MALQKQHIPVVLTGMDTKTDDKNLAPGQLVLAKNVVMNKSNKWSNRYGYTQIKSTQYLNARWFSYDGAFLTLGTDQEVYGIGSIGSPVSLGSALYTFSNYYPASPQSFCQFINSPHNFVTFNADGTVVNIYVGGKFAYQTRVDPIYATTSQLYHSICSDGNAVVYTVIPGATTINALTTAARTQRTVVVSGASMSRCAAMYTGSKSYVLMVYARAGNTYGYIWNYTDNTAVTEFLIHTTHDATCFSAGCCLAACSDGKFHVAVPTSAASWNLYTVTTTGTVAAASPASQASSASLTSINLLSAVVMTYGGVVWHSGALVGPLDKKASYIGSLVYDKVIVSKPSADTNNTIMMSSSGSHVGTADASLDAQWIYSSGYQMIGLNFGYPLTYPISQSYLSATEMASFVSGDNVGVVVFNSTALPMVCSYNGQNYTNAGGTVTLIESGTNLLSVAGYYACPSSIYSATPSASGGTLATGVYKFFLAWKYTDSQGKSYYSPQSKDISASVTGATGSVTVGWYQDETSRMPAERHATTLGITDLVLWATEANGDVFYSQGTVSYSGAGLDSVVVTSISLSEPWPFLGGIVESDGLPPCGAVSTCLGRVWAPLAMANDTWMFSAQASPNFGPRFPNGFSLRTSAEHGRPQIAVEMDNKILLFHEYGVFVTWGEGPDETGSGQFAQPILVTQSVGCKYPRSCVLTDAGVMFMSYEGVYLITKSLQPVYAGKDVEDYNSLVITGAHNLVDRHQVWMYSSDGTVLCYDEYHQRWSVFTGLATNATAMVDGVPYINSTSDLRIWKEDKTSYTNNGTAFDCELKTGWISLAGLQGFERMYKLTFSGSGTTDATLTLYRDWSASSYETFTVAAAKQTQWQVRPSIQKVEAIQFDLKWTGITGAVEVSAFAVEAGLKGGTFKVAPSTNRIQGN